ncbi:MAG: flagellar basal body-associated FliL family protein [Pseudomonadota bacterium]
MAGNAELQNDIEEVKPKKSKALFLVIGIVLLVLILGGVTIALLFSGGEEDKEDHEEVSEVKLPAIYHVLKPAFILNFTDGADRRYVQLEVTVMVRDPATVAALELHTPVLRDSLIQLISTKDIEEVKSSEGRNLIKEESLKVINQFIVDELKLAPIEQVLFTSFVIQ